MTKRGFEKMMQQMGKVGPITTEIREPSLDGKTQSIRYIQQYVDFGTIKISVEKKSRWKRILGL